MSQATTRQISQLQQYLIGEHPRENGEWDMYCPLHDDSKRSASLNVKLGAWYCNACEVGGSITSLIRQKQEWVPPGVSNNGNGRSPRPGREQAEVTLTEGLIAGWHSALMGHPSALDYLIEFRGLSSDTIMKYKLGWRPERKVYTLPVYGPDREIWNVRFYNPNPPDDRRKIWGVKGYNSPPRLYPIEVLDRDPSEIIIAEGELDTLLALQAGYPAITRTGAADVWEGAWGELFAGRTVYLCHDADTKGQRANRRVARALHRVADVRIVELPYEVTDKHGKDLTDFLLEHDVGQLRDLLNAAVPFAEKKEAADGDEITVLDSFAAERVGKPVKLLVTVKGRKEPGYTIPKNVNLTCTRDAGTKCNVCPLNAAQGEASFDVSSEDSLVLALIDATTEQVHKELAGAFGVPGARCSKLQVEVAEHQAVEVLFARPALDHSDGTRAGEYKNIRLTSVGRHDTASNHTVRATGALYPHPRTQGNEFLAWEIEPMETSVDRFEIDDQAIGWMRRFQPRLGQRPLVKLANVAKEISAHVTHIHGRPEMHALMDLTFHSVLSFRFGGQLVHRGWLDSLVVGDTRTGKSEAAQQLVRHYRCGEIVGGEAASVAGLLGGLQQLGGRYWAVTWGVIPVNDKRLVVIDEVSGLLAEDIARLSDVRASGLARLTKIQQDVTHARTRLLWLGNPRNTDMSNYTYGVDAIRPLIGNSEDIARFDLAMAVKLDDVPPETINAPYRLGDLPYSSDACHALLMWAWTRQVDQIRWGKGAEDEVYKKANEMGRRYVESPPLVQAANVRIKIARCAAALAARTYSTDDNETLVIAKRHVQDAVKFIDLIYNMPAFGYAIRSREALEDKAEAERNRDDIEDYLRERPVLAKYLRSTGKFRRQDLEEVLNITREGANAIINTLWEARMIRKEAADVRVEPTLHSLLREGAW
jgi:hypothetical protein